MTWPIQHLTADDLDAFHSASLGAEATRHLESCPECRHLVERDRVLVQALESLSQLEPSPDLAERVLAWLNPPVRLPARVARLRRLAIAASVVIGLGGSIGWSLANRDLLLSWINQLASGLGSAAWVTVASVAQTLSEQSLVNELLRMGSSPLRLTLAATALAIGYGLALIGLRRLLLLPARPASHAG